MSLAVRRLMRINSTMSTSFIPSAAPTRSPARLFPLRNNKSIFPDCHINQRRHVQQVSHSIRTTTRASTAVPTSQPVPTTSPPESSTSPSEKTVLDVLKERGLFDTATAEHDALQPLLSTPIGVYTGFDPTADSLHLGNLLAIMALAWFQRMGHRVYAVVGGATGKVGDPSGKSTERPVLDDETIRGNLVGIEANIRQVLDRSAASMSAAGSTPGTLTVINNYDWVAPITFLDFLRDVGKYARVNSMLGKDSVRTRLESDDGISFTEFTYQLLQAYDFVHLSDTHDVSFQLGGSDQWGNITAGTELARKLRSRTLHGITFPLLTTSDGRKFGKSEKGALWLTADKLSPYEFYQFLFKTPDEDVIKFLKRLTFLPLEDIALIETSMGRADYVANTAQKKLAEEVTRIVHGEEGVVSALAATAAAAPGSQAVLSADTLETISGDMPSLSLPREEVVGKPVVDVIVKSGLLKSKGEARRLIKNGGGYINNIKIQNRNEQTIFEDADLIDDRLILLAVGKKNKLLIRVQ